MKHKLISEIKQIFTINSSNQPWHLAFSASISCVVPLFFTAIFHLPVEMGVVSSLAGMVFLYTLKTPLYHRMVVLMVCGYGMIVSFMLGAFCHLFTPLLPLMLGVITTIATMVVRFYKLPAPGNFFFVMTATLAAFMPPSTAHLLSLVGYFALGTMWACLVAFLYSLSVMKFITPRPVPKHEYDGFEVVILDSIILGIFVGFSVFLASLVGFDRPYWVPISTLAILQGMTLKSKWTRQIQRIIGTILGVVLAYFLLSLKLKNFEIALVMGVLAFLIEFCMSKNYGLATIFITPMTVYMAEISGVISGDAETLITARVADIAFGSVVGFVGGVCLHSLRFRAVLKRILLIKGV